MENDLSELYARLYLDQDVPVSLAGMLRALGIDVVTTLEAGLLGKSDPEQLNYAVSQDRVLVTHNRLDFEALHTSYLTEGRSHAGLIISAQRRDLHELRDRIHRLLNRLDRDQFRNGLFYA